jgi:BolA protein
MSVPFLRECLERAFVPEHLDIIDDSGRHVGHPGAAAGGGHYRVVIVAARFRGLARIDRERAVHGAVGGAVGTTIHALSIRAFTPEEWQGRP